MYLTLTTEEIEPGAVGGGSRLDGVKDVLAGEAIALLYAAVILGPFLVVGFLVWLGLRLLRRRETARLLAENFLSCDRTYVQNASNTRLVEQPTFHRPSSVRRGGPSRCRVSRPSGRSPRRC